MIFIKVQKFKNPFVMSKQSFGVNIHSLLNRWFGGPFQSVKILLIIKSKFESSRRMVDNKKRSLGQHFINKITKIVTSKLLKFFFNFLTKTFPQISPLFWLSLAQIEFFKSLTDLPL